MNVMGKAKERQNDQEHGRLPLGKEIRICPVPQDSAGIKLTRAKAAAWNKQVNRVCVIAAQSREVTNPLICN